MLRLEMKNGYETYYLYNILYDNTLTPKKVRLNKLEQDYTLTCKREQIVNQIIKNDLITKKDYSVIMSKRGKVNYVDVFLVIPDEYSSDKDKWDYAIVYSNFDNELSIEWKH